MYTEVRISKRQFRRELSRKYGCGNAHCMNVQSQEVLDLGHSAEELGRSAATTEHHHAHRQLVLASNVAHATNRVPGSLLRGAWPDEGVWHQTARVVAR